jgi:hypothetical protein
MTELVQWNNFAGCMRKRSLLSEQPSYFCVLYACLNQQHSYPYAVLICWFLWFTRSLSLWGRKQLQGTGLHEKPIRHHLFKWFLAGYEADWRSPFSQVRSTCPYQKPGESGSRLIILFIWSSFYIILPSTPGSSSWPLYSKLSNQIPIPTSVRSKAWHMPRQSHLHTWHA